MRSAAEEEKFRQSLDAPIERKEITLVPQDPDDHLPWQKEDERAKRKGYMAALPARRKDCFRSCIQPEGRMSMQWTEDRREASKAPSGTIELEEKETFTGRPLRRKQLSREVSRYENRTAQNLLKVKYHTLKFLGLVATWEQQKKKEEQHEINQANRGVKKQKD